MTSCAKLWPPNDPVRASLHWSHLAGILLGRNGMGHTLERPLLIGIRGAAPGDAETHEIHSRPSYDDSYVLVQKTTMPMLFRGATHAYQLDSRAAPDENGDGRGDVGSIRPGRFVLTDTDSQPSPIFTVALPDGSTKIPAWRDLNHDGRLDDTERDRAEAARKGNQVNADGYFATAVLVHVGWPIRSSISCLTMDERYLFEIRHAARYHDGKLDCILEDASELATIFDTYESGLEDEVTKKVNIDGSVA